MPSAHGLRAIPVRSLSMVTILVTLLLALGASVILGGQGSYAAQAATPQQYRVLFIGNSLTSKNKLPDQFMSLARSGGKKVKVYSSLIPSATLDQHTRNPTTLRLLWSINWTHVVLQEQSATLSFNLPGWEAERTWPAAKYISDSAKRDGRTAKIVLYETMAYIGGNFVGDSYEGMQQRIIDGYERVRKYIGAETAPVGKVWRRARREMRARNESNWLLYADDVHPSPRGTFLAATVIYRQIFGQRVDRLRPRLAKGVSRAFSLRAMRWTEEEYAALLG